MRARFFLPSLASFLVLASAAARSAEAPLVVPALGEPFRGQLLAAEASGILRFADAPAVREMPLGDLALWGALVPPAPGSQIILAGGGLIVADNLRIENEQVRGDSQVFGELALPLELVAGILFRPPHDENTLDQWTARMTAATGQSDRVLLDNGDELTGTILGLDDPIRQGKVLRLQTEAGKTDLAAEKVTAVIFNPTLLDKSRPGGLRTLAGFRDGSRLLAAEFVADKTNCQVKLAGGAQLKAPTEKLVALQVFGGRVVYLSDLKPASYRHIPYLQLSWPYQADRSVLGSQLRAGGNLFAKGLGMHSPARITYDLGGPYRRFQAEGAIDREAGPRGSVVFRVFTDDGSGAWQERFVSQTVRGGEGPTPISVDLTGAKRISLLVDYADRGDELDHADWLNARIVR